MRLATINTPRGLRLHVRAHSGYVDVADATGESAFAALHGLLTGGPAAMDAARALMDLDGAEFDEADFGPAVPEPRRILCLGVNYREHAIEGGREVPTWPEAFVRGEGSAVGPYADLVRPLPAASTTKANLAWSSVPAAGTYRRTKRSMPLRATWWSTTPRPATGSGPPRSGPAVRISKARCRSGLKW